MKAKKPAKTQKLAGLYQLSEDKSEKSSAYFYYIYEILKSNIKSQKVL
jgi:hypothetical protein